MQHEQDSHRFPLLLCLSGCFVGVLEQILETADPFSVTILPSDYGVAPFLPITLQSESQRGLARLPACWVSGLRLEMEKFSVRIVTNPLLISREFTPLPRKVQQTHRILPTSSVQRCIASSGHSAAGHPDGKLRHNGKSTDARDNDLGTTLTRPDPRG